jgi:hypothetical protein
MSGAKMREQPQAEWRVETLAANAIVLHIM